MMLRKMRRSEVPLIARWERDAENRPFICPWDELRHLEALADPDCRYFILDEGGRSIGFVLLAGISTGNGVVEFRRIVVNEKGRGLGRAAVEKVKAYCFEDLKAHRLWLDVFEDNVRARSLYETAGFRVEGILRDSVWSPDGFRSLVVMSMLAPEYLASPTAAHGRILPPD